MSTSRRHRRQEQSFDECSSESEHCSGRSCSHSRQRSWDHEHSKKTSKKKITEEEIAEYLAKKALKKAVKVAQKLKSQAVSGYSNDSNPFGDSNLGEKNVLASISINFIPPVWRKKIERDVAQVVPLDNFSHKVEKKRRRERMAEIEKVKKQREERAIEKAQHEEEMALLARERARAEFQDWEKREEEFHFDQSKIRSKIRLREGRIKHIDILTEYLNPSDELEIDISEPYMVLKGLSVKEMEDLHNDIKMHLDLDRATPTHIKFWEALEVVCGWELAEARKGEALERARVRGERLSQEMINEERGLHASTEADVRSLLQGKTFSELEVLQSQIESQMQSGTAKVVEYWEAVLKRLHLFKAKACLKEIHAKLLHTHFGRPKTPTEDEIEKTERASSQDKPDGMVEEGDVIFSPLNEEELAGSYSPEMLHGDDNEDAIDPEEDKASLENRRSAVLEERRALELASRPAPSEDNFEKNAIKAMGAVEESDAVFGSNDEINLDSQVYWWHDKYRPRKPKYFNRVHTGYEWNKYNQTHYDHDNPPPKVVQGYKLNIFYPDLVDRSKAPFYTIEKDGESTDTCIIRFHAGPPYEEIAFRIVIKEWEYSHKKGFKCTFERGILHVYFNFKRYRYRR